jgi:hypothetical protein
MVIGYHLILMGYGHWLPNDPRGSYSSHIASKPLQELGEIHQGRRIDQPTRSTLREFYRDAEQKLYHPVLWWESSDREILSEACQRVIQREQLTCYAAAILNNHIHLLIRKHRLSAESMWAHFMESGRASIADKGRAPSNHPVFSGGGGRQFKSTEHQMWTCVNYIQDNFHKHRIEPTPYTFVTPYDGWPGRRGRR